MVGTGCVQQRPSRNGVFNENQYLRKDFLIAPGDGKTPDPGWFVKSTIVAASTPNVLASVNGGGLFVGAEGGAAANFVRFQVTQDKLQILNLREIINDPTINAEGITTAEVANAWPITNVDLKYRVTLDGEKTNFYEENQELDWQVRQWVKINFAKNDLSDLYAFGANTNPVIQNCVNLTDASTTLVTDSFLVDTANDNFEFTLSVTAPISFDDKNAAACVAAFGTVAYDTFNQLQRQNVTLNLRTVFVRPSQLIDGTYVPFPIAEKDPIQHKYGALQTVAPFRDPTTGLLGAQQFVNRHNPNKDIVYYLAKGMPAPYQQFFARSGGLVDQTNTEIFTKTGQKGRLKVLNYNDAAKYGDAAGPERLYGDPRYNFIVWHSDLDNGSGLLGVMQPFADPRTGEQISASVNVWEGPFKDSVQQRLDLFLQTVGAEYLLPSGEFDDTKYPATCMDGDTIPLVPADIAANFNAQSTVYSKMQAYLQRPFATNGYLGPADFLPTHDSDFYNAYFAVIPYQTYADPQANQFVIPDGTPFADPTATAAVANWQGLQNTVQFQQLAGQLDQGQAPFDIDGATAVGDAVAFYNNYSTLARQVTDYEHTRHYSKQMRTADDISLFSYFDVYQKNGRHCVGGKWESRASYTTNLIQSLNEATVTHEFGHALGLAHNFMGSIDQRNFPLDSQGHPMMYASSIMDYNQQLSEAFFETNENTTYWGPYDIAALGWIYSNNLSTTTVGPFPVPAGSTSTTISQQVSPTAPWNDPLGFNGTTEKQFQFCSDEHTKYTPLCRRYDMGVTPSEILANDIQRREWNYLWTNFRLYHKYFSEENYPTSVANDFNEMRRFLSLWNYDWSGGELSNDLRLIGTTVPPGSTVADYYNQLTAKFDTDISAANQLMVTYHRAITEQSSGERPYITQFDGYYGDVTQQGIFLDKAMAVSSFSELWPAVSNYDPSQAAGSYIAGFGGFIGDAAYSAVASQFLSDYLGASYATYTYAQVGPIASFAASTHSAKYNGSLELQTWVGGHVFSRDRDFLDFVHQIAVANNFQNCDENGNNCAPCTSIDSCTWDPRNRQVTSYQITQSDRYNQFQSPDGRTYIWGYLVSRNQWVLADRDRNNATYALMYAWNQDVVNGEDDGYNGASYLEYKVRYIVDAFTYYDGQSLAAP
jgi:hypothetical protein